MWIALSKEFTQTVKEKSSGKRMILKSLKYY
jgi:hypothetical protein